MSGVIALSRLEILRAVRNKRVLVFSVLMPTLFFLLVASQTKGSDIMTGTNVSVRTYYLIAYASFGAIAAALNANAQKISIERKEGWIRQLRLTALPGNGYVTSKIIASFVATVPAIGIVFVVGALMGVRLPLAHWLAAFGVLWLGTLCFTALGILIGYSIPADSVPLVGSLVWIMFSFLGGQFFAITGSLEKVAKVLPSYQIRQLATDVVTNQHLPSSGILVLVAWVVGASFAAARMYRRGLESV
jgi:ABC-2 type transport system permease protein